MSNAWYVVTADGGKYIFKQEREDKEFQPQNDLTVEAAVIRGLSGLGLSVPLPHVVAVSENPKVYGYDYIEGDLMRGVWGSLSETERVSVCETLGQFHSEIGRKFTKEIAEAAGVKIDPSTDVHPEVAADYRSILESVDVPEEWKSLAREARLILDGTMDGGVFQFLHNDSHHENILIKDRAVSGIIDFGNAEYGEVAKEFSRYIRDFPDYFPHIVSAYEESSGEKLSYERLVSYALLSGLIDIVEDYRKGGERGVKAANAIATYRNLMSATS